MRATPFPGKKLSFMFLILAPLVPTVALITPIYMMIQEAGLIGSKLGIIFIHAAKALPFTVLILSIFFRKQPTELFEAATIDGCVTLPELLPHRRADGAAGAGRDRALRLHALLCRVHVRDGALRRRFAPARHRW